MNFVAFDIEMPTQTVYAISAIGVTIVRDNKIKKRFYTLVNPETGFSKYVIKLIGITPDMVKDAPTLPEVWEEIGCYFTGGDVIVSHGAHGDILTLIGALQRYKIELEGDIKYLCTCDMTLAESPDLEHHSLDYLCEHFDITLSHHNAQSDSDGCAELLLKYIENGLDEEKYIRTINIRHFLERQSARMLSARLRQRKKNAINDFEAAGPASFDYERQFYRFFEEHKSHERAKRIQSSLNRELTVFGVEDAAIRKKADSLDDVKLTNLLSQKKFASYEMYRLYVFAFNRRGEQAKNFLNVLVYLPSYNALYGINVELALFAVSREAAFDIVADELSKFNVFGFDALAVRIIKHCSCIESAPEKTIEIIKRILVYHHVRDEIMTNECIYLLNKLIAAGFEDRIKKIPLSKRLKRRLTFREAF